MDNNTAFGLIIVAAALMFGSRYFEVQERNADRAACQVKDGKFIETTNGNFCVKKDAIL